ncbi:DUF2842 domain-containing protein [Sphingomicrobium marinum]|uniref:DUF2842 domain-containing protein n=1 Tax=Sphingomicrobium marinum TaxID=1227950 RepID=UPI00223EEC82|nr:DUF2842 domain-containing protein [Sphingomicrobium marinum]
MHEPKSRTLLGTFAILAWLTFYVWAILEIVGDMARWPFIIQMLFFLVAGLAWIIPLKPLLRWMEAGRKA